VLRPRMSTHHFQHGEIIEISEEGLGVRERERERENEVQWERRALGLTDIVETWQHIFREKNSGIGRRRGVCAILSSAHLCKLAGSWWGRLRVGQ
jgi:hypothetical protein